MDGFHLRGLDYHDASRTRYARTHAQADFAPQRWRTNPAAWRHGDASPDGETNYTTRPRHDPSADLRTNCLARRYDVSARPWYAVAADWRAAPTTAWVVALLSRTLPTDYGVRPMAAHRDLAERLKFKLWLRGRPGDGVERRHDGNDGYRRYCSLGRRSLIRDLQIRDLTS